MPACRLPPAPLQTGVLPLNMGSLGSIASCCSAPLLPVLRREPLHNCLWDATAQKG